MIDRTSSPRAVRLGLAGAVVVVVVLVGSAVALAVGDDDPDATHNDESHHDDHDDHDADEAAAQAATMGDSTPRTNQRGGMGGAHDHPALPPYDERHAEASSEDQAAADDLLAEVRATLTAFQDVDAAVAAGYQAPRNPRSPRAHYLDRSVAEDGHVLDPSRPNGLVYYTGGQGDAVLLGAYFVALPGVEAPTPAGELVVWHSHSPACPDFHATDEAPCTDTRRMLHVWTVEQFEATAGRTGRTGELRVVDPFGAAGAAFDPAT
jgi:hypothetical protein